MQETEREMEERLAIKLLDQLVQCLNDPAISIKRDGKSIKQLLIDDLRNMKDTK